MKLKLIMYHEETLTQPTVYPTILRFRKATMVEGRLPALANWCNIFEIVATLLLTLTQALALVDAFVTIDQVGI